MNFFDAISGVFKAATSHVGSIMNSWGHDPERAVLGINTPLESALWGGILGKNYAPNINMMGGPTAAQKQGMADSGINMSLAGPAYKIADTVAAIAGAAGAGAALGLGGSAGAAPAAGGEALGAGAGEAGGLMAGTAGGGAAAAPAVAAPTATGGTMAALSKNPLFVSGAMTVANSLLAKSMAPAAPEVKPPTAMPDPQAQEAARQRKIAEQIARRGRASTILTEPANRLGG